MHKAPFSEEKLHEIIIACKGLIKSPNINDKGKTEAKNKKLEMERELILRGL